MSEVVKQVTKEEIAKALPSRKGAITDEIVDLVNASQTEPEFQGETLLQTAGTYEQVMTRNRASLRQYLDAVKFCAYMISFDDNYTEAYKKTFGYRDFVKDRINEDTNSNKYIELVSSASRYRKSKLVNEIMTYSQVPLKMLYRGHAYQAMGVLQEVMVHGKLDRDRVAAAKTILEATKDDENVKIELDIGVKESSAVQQLNEQLSELANKSLTHLHNGTMDVSKLGSMKVKEEIIDAEVE